MNLLGDRRLGDVKLLRRPRKAQILRHRHKTFHLKYGHFLLLFNKFFLLIIIFSKFTFKRAFL